MIGAETAAISPPRQQNRRREGVVQSLPRQLADKYLEIVWRTHRLAMGAAPTPTLQDAYTMKTCKPSITDILSKFGADLANRRLEEMVKRHQADACPSHKHRLAASLQRGVHNVTQWVLTWVERYLGEKEKESRHHSLLFVDHITSPAASAPTQAAANRGASAQSRYWVTRLGADALLDALVALHTVEEVSPDGLTIHTDTCQAGGRGGGRGGGGDDSPPVQGHPLAPYPGNTTHRCGSMAVGHIQLGILRRFVADLLVFLEDNFCTFFLEAEVVDDTASAQQLHLADAATALRSLNGHKDEKERKHHRHTAARGHTTAAAMQLNHNHNNPKSLDVNNDDESLSDFFAILCGKYPTHPNIQLVTQRGGIRGPAGPAKGSSAAVAAAAAVRGRGGARAPLAAVPARRGGGTTRTAAARRAPPIPGRGRTKRRRDASSSSSSSEESDTSSSEESADTSSDDSDDDDDDAEDTTTTSSSSEEEDDSTPTRRRGARGGRGGRGRGRGGGGRMSK